VQKDGIDGLRGDGHRVSNPETGEHRQCAREPALGDANVEGTSLVGQAEQLFRQSGISVVPKKG
jgi:hypothetical protein